MIFYIARRILQLVPVLLIMSIVVFGIAKALPGDPTVTVLGDTATPEQRARLRAELGLDESIAIQYGKWLSRAAVGDLGNSLRSHEPISSMIASRAPVTFQLTALAIVLSIIVGIPLGVIAARKRGTWVDLVVSSFAISGMAIPFFWLGVLLILLFSVRLGWLPPSGYVPFFSDPLRNLTLMVLPAITVGLSMSALVMRQTRTAMLQILNQDHVRTARAKGLSERVVIVKHALRNALNPIVTVVGLQIGVLLGGAVVTETVFSIPGLGRMLVDGIFQRDFAAVQGAILVIVLGVLIVNLVADVLYATLDRRIKL
jgi:peptide/nickel transport system permease protein